MKIVETYKFRNGIEAKFTFDSKRHTHDVEWSIALIKKVYEQIKDEYYNECIPAVYQKISNIIGQTIIYADKYMTCKPKVFKPDNIN